MNPFIAGVLLPCALFVPTAGVDRQGVDLKAGTPAGKPRCIRTIELDNFGGMVARFGDLNGDGQDDAVFVQSDDQRITCITALELNGRRLWQRGEAHERNRRLS